MKHTLNEKALGISFALVSALCMLILGIFGYLEIYTNAVNSMSQWHIFFSISVVGIIAGILEAAVISFILGWLIARIYNKFI